MESLKFEIYKPKNTEKLIRLKMSLSGNGRFVDVDVVDEHGTMLPQGHLIRISSEGIHLCRAVSSDICFPLGPECSIKQLWDYPS